MAYKLGVKQTCFYAARDPLSGEYLEASGWGYSDGDGWKVRRAIYHTQVRQLSSKLDLAHALLAGLPDYWQREIDVLIDRKAQPGYRWPVLQEQIDYNIQELQRIQARRPELMLIRVTTEVTETSVP